jgi:hypothetical protein
MLAWQPGVVLFQRTAVLLSFYVHSLLFRIIKPGPRHLLKSLFNDYARGQLSLGVKLWMLFFQPIELLEVFAKNSGAKVFINHESGNLVSQLAESMALTI